MTDFAVPELPENEGMIAAWDAALRKDPPAVLAAAAKTRQRYQERGIDTITGVGWPLRPLFIPASILEGLGRSLFQRFDELRRALLDRAGDPDRLFEAVPFGRDLFANLDFAASLESDLFLSVLRPDGFLYPDRFVLSEPNFGNGVLISNAYTEILFDWYTHSPMNADVQWDPGARLTRPFRHYLDLLRTYLPPDKPEPFVALFSHHWEQGVIMSWEKRVIDQLHLAQQLMEADQIHNRIVNEDGLLVDASGTTRVAETGELVDCVAQFSIGTSFADEPERFDGGDLAHLRGVRIGNTPLVKPIASLCVEKGTLPFMRNLPHSPVNGGFPIEIPPTEFPRSADAPRYRRDRSCYALKRAFDGKDTRIGVTTLGRPWNTCLQGALDRYDYVIQEYRPLSRTVMPVPVDERRIEWVEARVELSPFIIGGRYAGAIARYAPDAEGLIMSPPPSDMGLTMVYAA